MKLKILGIPILEITTEPPKQRTGPGEPASDAPSFQHITFRKPIPDEDSGPSRHGWEDTLDAKSQMNASPPRILTSVVNLGAASTEPTVEFEGILPASPAQPNTKAELSEPVEPTLDALHKMSAQGLLQFYSRQQKLDVDLVLNRFKLSEEEILGSNFRVGTAGFRLREAVRMRQHRKRTEAVPPENAGERRKAIPASPAPEVEALRRLFAVNANELPRLTNGKLDMLGSLKQLNIGDPRTLWKIKPPYGSALHLLKQAIGCRVGNGAPVDFGNGITHQEVKEVLSV